MFGNGVELLLVLIYKSINDTSHTNDPWVHSY